MLVYTLPELAAEYRTSKENVYILESLGEIQSIMFSSQKVVSIFEAERFLKESAGRDFKDLIEDAKKRKQLAKMGAEIVEMKKKEVWDEKTKSN